MTPGLTFARRDAVAGFGLGRVQNVALWSLVASSWLLSIEPAPYDYLVLLVLLVFLPGGLAIPRTLLPVCACLLLYNLGGLLSLVPVADDPRSVRFAAVSVFMAVAAILYSAVTAGDPHRRGKIVVDAYVVAGVMAAIFGLIGYFGIGGMAEALSKWDRAQGTFKDPNVFSVFLVPPLCFLIQGFLLGSHRRGLLAGLALATIFAGLFFGFSRGAWFNAAIAIFLLFGLTYLTARSGAVRWRIVVTAIAGSVVAGAFVAGALSFDSVRELFDARANFLNSYDAGETGRFGNQLNSIPLLLEMPNGMGPHQFRTYFGQDPHNVFINAFASYGWLGGFAFAALNVLTLAAGFRAIFTDHPWRQPALAVFCPLAAIMVQGFQIDTDHWRHFYLLLGLLWGYYAAMLAWQGKGRPA
ncbi:MAG TPA: O-antigen ligase family protein [Aestuariivirgaceae bacterium]|nr:O-antigen ligase family protein [Aestuariivirgaceae bacterium]